MAKRNGGGDKRSIKKRTQDAERKRLCFEMARRGSTIEEIRVELGLAGRQGVHYLLRAALREHVGPAAKDHLKRELRRIDIKLLQLDAIFAGLTRELEVTVTGDDIVECRGGAFTGNVEAADAAMKCLAEQRKWVEHRCRLLNLLKPTPIALDARSVTVVVAPEWAGAIAAPPSAPALEPHEPTGTQH